MIQTKYAKEIIGAYGTCDGIHCPYCGTRQYPIGRGGKEAKCLCCGYPYILPPGYYRREK